MLTKPEAGWSNVKVNGIILGRASYLTDVPQDTLNALIGYIKNEMGTSCLEYDAEGYTFGIFKMSDDFYAFDTRSFNESCLYVQYLGHGIEFAKKLLAEATSDIENEFPSWARWSPGSGVDEQEYEENKAELVTLICKAHDILR